jgi:hypothetical protein
MTNLLLIFAFMLIPIWIPLVTVSIGAVTDAVRSDS